MEAISLSLSTRKTFSHSDRSLQIAELTVPSVA